MQAVRGHESPHKNQAVWESSSLSLTHKNSYYDVYCILSKNLSESTDSKTVYSYETVMSFAQV